jgi:hypothetical protein
MKLSLSVPAILAFCYLPSTALGAPRSSGSVILEKRDNTTANVYPGPEYVHLRFARV